MCLNLENWKTAFLHGPVKGPRSDLTVSTGHGCDDELQGAPISVSDTSVIYAIVWDILFSLYIIYLLIPKRYAITKTHLFADGQRYDWNNLRFPKKQPKTHHVAMVAGEYLVHFHR